MFRVTHSYQSITQISNLTHRCEACASCWRTHIFSDRDDRQRASFFFFGGGRGGGEKSKPRLPNQIPIHNADWFKSHFRQFYPMLIGWKFTSFPRFSSIQCWLNENSLLFHGFFTGLLSLPTWVTTKDHIRAEHKLHSISKLFISQVITPQVMLVEPTYIPRAPNTGTCIR